MNTNPIWHVPVGQGFLPSNFNEYVETVDMSEYRTLWTPDFIVLHNTAMPKFADWHKVSGEAHMQNLEHYYRDFLGWSAGPHLFVADDLIWVFTPLNIRGVHSPSWNSVSWGVELVGDYNNEPLLSTVKSNAIIAIAALCNKCKIAPETLKLHHEDPKTTHKGCPGRNVVKQEFIHGVQFLLNQGS
jgi:N-acetylmuramoyl-L-alanine amidase CwlA